MKRALLAALAALALAAPASAQYYGNPYSQFEDEWDEPAPRYRYERRPDYGYDWDDGYEYRREYRYGPPQRSPRRVERRGRQMGNVCYTSRGSCEYPRFMPLQTPCRCQIPGFGPKRGAILY